MGNKDHLVQVNLLRYNAAVVTQTKIIIIKNRIAQFIGIKKDAQIKKSNP